MEEGREKHHKMDSLPAGCKRCQVVLWWGGNFWWGNEAIGHLTELLKDFPRQTAHFHKAKLSWSGSDRELAVREESVCASFLL